LVEREASERASMQTTARLRRARLKHAATPEDVDYRVARGLVVRGETCRRYFVVWNSKLQKVQRVVIE